MRIDERGGVGRGAHFMREEVRYEEEEKKRGMKQRSKSTSKSTRQGKMTYGDKLPAIQAEQVEDDVAPVTAEYVPAKMSHEECAYVDSNKSI